MIYINIGHIPIFVQGKISICTHFTTELNPYQSSPRKATKSIWFPSFHNNSNHGIPKIPFLLPRHNLHHRFSGPSHRPYHRHPRYPHLRHQLHNPRRKSPNRHPQQLQRQHPRRNPHSRRHRRHPRRKPQRISRCKPSYPRQFRRFKSDRGFHICECGC